MNSVNKEMMRQLLLGLFFSAPFALAVQDFYVPPDECAAVKTDFMKLPRPFDGKQIEHYNQFCSTYEMKLKGAWKRFAEAYTTEEIVYALWSLLDHDGYDAEAAAVLNAKAEIRYTGGFFYLPFVNGHPEGWAEHKRSVVENVKWDCRRKFGLEYDWNPHPLLFRNKSEKEFQILGRDETCRAEWIQAFRGWLGDSQIVSSNPLEIRKIFKAISAMDAWELSGEIANLFFYDTRTGRNFRLHIPESPPNNYYGSFQEWKEHPDVPPPFPGVIAPTVLLWRNGEARGKAVSLVLRRYAKTDADDLSETIGGGFADALVISYLQNPSLRLSQEKCRQAIDWLIVSDSSLGDGEIARLLHLKAVLSGMKYQVNDKAVRSEWFGQVPLTHKIMPTGDVLVGRAFGERFFTFYNAKGWVGKMRPQWLALHTNEIVNWPKDLFDRKDRFYWLNYAAFQDPVQERQVEEYKKKLLQELGPDLLLSDQLPQATTPEELFYRY